jgi:hypothetical protein
MTMTAIGTDPISSDEPMLALLWDVHSQRVLALGSGNG